DRSDVRCWDQVVGVLPRVEVVLDREGRCSPTQCYGCGNRRSQREGSRCAIQSRHWNVVAVHLNDDLGHVGRNYAAVGAIDDGGVGNLEYCVAVAATAACEWLCTIWVCSDGWVPTSCRKRRVECPKGRCDRQITTIKRRDTRI